MSLLPTPSHRQVEWLQTSRSRQRDTSIQCPQLRADSTSAPVPARAIYCYRGQRVRRDIPDPLRSTAIQVQHSARAGREARRERYVDQNSRLVHGPIFTRTESRYEQTGHKSEPLSEPPFRAFTFTFAATVYQTHCPLRRRGH
jgi:hypothetical protein